MFGRVPADSPWGGLFTLWDLKRLGMSMENLVLQPRYASLFTDEELKIARKRLEDLKFTPVIAAAPSSITKKSG